MSLGVEVRSRNAPASRGAPTDTGTAFVVGKAGTGPLDKASLVRSIGDVAGVYGPRVTANAKLYDWLDVFFREGGQRAYVGRYTDVGTIDSGLALFSEGLGPGQLVATDETPGADLYGTLLDHAENFNRYALCDVANGGTLTEIEALGDAFIAIGNSDYGLLVGPWLPAPGPAGVIGAGPRQVPASAAVAGFCNRADLLGNPNRAAAGRDFPLQYATGVVTEFTDADRETLLNQHAVNTFGEEYGVLQLYGFQTGVAQSDQTPYWQANCGRARMWLKARAKAAGVNYRYKPIDGRGRLAHALKTDLDGICLELYAVDGLFGDTPADAFSTEIGVSVNTTSEIAQGDLHAVTEARLSLHAKAVFIDLVSVPVTGRVTTPA